MGSYIGAAIVWAPLYALPAAIGVVPALLSLRHRGGRALLPDWATLYVPLLVWIAAAANLDRPKSLGNVVELPMLGVAVAVAAVIRGLAGGGRRDRVLSWAFLVLACILAMLVAVLTPLLPE